MVPRQLQSYPLALPVGLGGLLGPGPGRADGGMEARGRRNVGPPSQSAWAGAGVRVGVGTGAGAGAEVEAAGGDCGPDVENKMG